MTKVIVLNDAGFKFGISEHNYNLSNIAKKYQVERIAKVLLPDYMLKMNLELTAFLLKDNNFDFVTQNYKINYSFLETKKDKEYNKFWNETMKNSYESIKHKIPSASETILNEMQKNILTNNK